MENNAYSNRKGMCRDSMSNCSIECDAKRTSKEQKNVSDISNSISLNFACAFCLPVPMQSGQGSLAQIQSASL